MPKRTTTMMCSDCGFTSETTARKVHAARRPRCPKCGGPMNRPRDLRQGPVATSSTKKRRRTRKPKDADLRTDKTRERLSSENTVLWFGKHKGVAIRNVPTGYLRWMVENINRDSWRMEVLCGFIAEYLSKKRCGELAA
jgi:hypothetical protein